MCSPSISKWFISRFISICIYLSRYLKVCLASLSGTKTNESALKARKTRIKRGHQECVSFLNWRVEQQLWLITSQLVHFADTMQIYLWPWDWEKMKSSYISKHSHTQCFRLGESIQDGNILWINCLRFPFLEQLFQLYTQTLAGWGLSRTGVKDFFCRSQQDAPCLVSHGAE